jgi:branched-chain amino acid transport system permease protein
MIDILTSEAFLMVAAINIIAAVGMNLVYVSGQLNLGQAGFLAVGAYTTAVLDARIGLPLPVLLLASAAVAAIVALPVALGANRVRGIYLIMGTMAVGEVVRVTIGNVDALGGIQGFSGHSGIGVGAVLWTLVTVTVAATVLMASRLGLRMRSIFDDEDAAAAAGVATRRVKVLSVVISAAVVAIAGGLLAKFFLFIAPRNFGLLVSFHIALYTLIGGVHSLAGAFTGGFGITYFLEVLRKVGEIGWVPTSMHFLSPWRFVVYGAVVMLVMALLPEGLVTRRMALRVLRPARRVARRLREREPPAERGHEVAGDGVVLSIGEVSHRFGGVVALADVSFEVRRGEILALIGANGAGKTTLINVVGGRHRSQQGTIRLNGLDLVGLRPERRAVVGISRTFQSVRMFAHLTVEEAVRLGHLAAGGRPSRTVAEILDLVGLAEKADHLPDSLTLAEQRRLEIGRAMASAPHVVFLDEPSVGMNEAERTELAQLVRSLGETGTTVVVVDHNLDLALGVADRVAVLDFGRVLTVSTPDEVFNDPRVREAYLGSREAAPGEGEEEDE